MGGIDPHGMSGWAWALMALMTVLWLVVAAAAVYIAIVLTGKRDDRGREA